MKVLFDAGCLINLANGGLLEALCSTPSYTGHLGQLVRGECVSNRNVVDALIKGGGITLLPDLEISAADFAKVLHDEGLGVGETECLLTGLRSDFVVSCDDRTARNRLQGRLGPARVTGTLGLLRRANHDGLLEIASGFEAYERMRRAGGFLPNLGMEAFNRFIAGH